MCLPNEYAKRDKRANKPVCRVYGMVCVLNERKHKSERSSFARCDMFALRQTWYFSLARKVIWYKSTHARRHITRRRRISRAKRISQIHAVDLYRWKKDLLCKSFFLAPPAGLEPATERESRLLRFVQIKSGYRRRLQHRHFLRGLRLLGNCRVAAPAARRFIRPRRRASPRLPTSRAQLAGRVYEPQGRRFIQHKRIKEQHRLIGRCCSLCLPNEYAKRIK